MTNSQNKDKVDKNEELDKVVKDAVEKDEVIDLTKQDIDVIKKANARLNVHKHVRNFLIVLVKIAQKHAKENPQSELAGLGMILIPISKHIIDAIVKEIESDPEDLCKLIEFFYHKLREDGFFIADETTTSETKEEG